MAPAQVITEFPLPVPNSLPYRVVGGPDGNVWFSHGGVAGDEAPNKI